MVEVSNATRKIHALEHELDALRCNRPMVEVNTIIEALSKIGVIMTWEPGNMVAINKLANDLGAEAERINRSLHRCKSAYDELRFRMDGLEK
jgi:hypothetical protein